MRVPSWLIGLSDISDALGLIAVMMISLVVIIGVVVGLALCAREGWRWWRER